jgi:hypothetical protein
MMGNYDLFACDWMPPFLVAPGSSDSNEPVMAKDADHMV